MLLKHSAIYSASLLINGLIGFLAVAINTRILGVESYGYYALAFSTAMFASTFLFEWVRLSLMRFSETDGGPRLLSASLSIYVVGGAIILFVTMGLYFTSFDYHFPAFGWMAVGLFAVCVGFAELFMGLARASLRPSLFAIMQLTRGTLALLLGSAAAWAGYGFVGLILGMAIANVLSVILGFIRYPVWQSLRPCWPDKESFTTLSNFGFPIIMTIIAVQILQVLDRFVISYFHGPAAVGAYAAAGDVTQKLIFMLAAGINLASYNLAVQAFEKNGRTAAEQRLSSTLTVLLTLIVPVAVGIALVAKPLGQLMFGAEVAKSAAILMPLLSLAALLQVIRSCFIEQPYHILKMTRDMLLPFAIAASVALIVWFLLVPAHGAFGTACGLVLAHIVGSFLSMCGMKGKFTYIVEWKNILKIGMATLFMATIVGLLPWPEDNMGVLFIRIVAGASTYAAVALSVNLLDSRTIVMRKLSAPK